MKTKVMEESARIVEKYNELFLEQYRVWLKDIVFTWQWWFELIVITTLPWVAWFILRNKEQTHRLLYAGFFVLIIACFLDMVGLCLALWCYPHKLLPFLPQYISWDFCAMPVSIMLSIQYTPKIKPWIKAFLYAGIAAFIVQPAAEWMHLYHPMHWKHWYSFPIIFLIYMGAYHFYSKAGSEWMKSKESKP